MYKILKKSFFKSLEDEGIRIGELALEKCINIGAIATDTDTAAWAQPKFSPETRQRKVVLELEAGKIARCWEGNPSPPCWRALATELSCEHLQIQNA